MDPHKLSMVNEPVLQLVMAQWGRHWRCLGNTKGPEHPAQTPSFTTCTPTSHHTCTWNWSRPFWPWNRDTPKSGNRL